MSKYKEDIIRLRKQDKSYREIENELECSKGTIAYHCKQEGLEDIGKKQEEVSDEKKEKIREYYKDHTREQTAKQFDVSESTVQKYSEKKKKPKTKTVGSRQHTKKTGDTTELKVTTRLVELGYTVLEPYGENDPYDLVFENENGEFQRVQCKTPRSDRSDETKLKVRACSVVGGETYTYHGQIDFFATYSKQTEKCYLVPFEEVEDCYHSFSLRLKPAKNGQKCRMAKDFIL